MKVAFTVLGDRIAPVFDVAQNLLVLELDAERIVSESEAGLSGDMPVQKSLSLKELGINIVVCGAISRPMQAMVSAYGVRVIPYIAGEIEEVKKAWLENSLESGKFAMPGFCGRGRRRRRRFNGMGAAGCMGFHQGGGRRMRTGSSAEAFPHCGYYEPLGY